MADDEHALAAGAHSRSPDTGTTGGQALNKTIWLLWFQGWDKAPWMIREVAASWRRHNPGWNVICLDEGSVRDFVKDAPYLGDPEKTITAQARSDIIRLSLLMNHGGVWADATMLCMQPLDPWAEQAVAPAGLWMYHAHGGKRRAINGVASWFIVARRGSMMIRKWKAACDRYWSEHDAADHYFWMDRLFGELFDADPEFREAWSRAPHLYGRRLNQAHGLSTRAGVGIDTRNESFRRAIRDHPPYALKLNWRSPLRDEPDPADRARLESNGYFAIRMARRVRVVPHRMESKGSPSLRLRMWAADAGYALKMGRKGVLKIGRMARSGLKRITGAATRA